MNGGTATQKPGLLGTIAVLEKVTNELFAKVSGGPTNQLVGEKTDLVPTSGVIDTSTNRIEMVIDLLTKIDQKLVF